MPYLESEGQRLLAALKPLVSYAERTRSTLDPADPKAASRFRFVRDVESALNAAADYAKAADSLLNPAPSPLVTRVRNLLAFQNDPAPLTAGKLAAYFPPHELR
jgi:hypothetical protein